MIDVEPSQVLVVDDVEANRDMLQRRLKRMGHEVDTAENGRRALEMLHQKQFDLVLLDIMMPEMNGYEVLEAVKGDPLLKHIPVVMISALDEVDSVVKCIEMGAEDYLTKPFNSVLLKARINASLSKKQMRDQEELYLHQVEAQMHRADELLNVILPAHIVEELKETNKVEPRRYDEVSLLLCDIVGFTPYSEKHDHVDVLTNLSQLTEAFERHTAEYGLEKINAVGDEFLAAGGLHGEQSNQVLECVMCGFKMIESARQLEAKWEVRVGVNVGPVIAGVVGSKKFLFGLWGDAVNTTARVQSHGEVGSVNVSKRAWDYIAGDCDGVSRGLIDVKGKGPMEIFRINGVIAKSI